MNEISLEMADVWPIENVWAILKDKVAQKSAQTAATESDCSSWGGD